MAQFIILFEDEGFVNLRPLTYNRPVYDLRCGVRLLHEKVKAAYPKAEFGYHVQECLTELVKQQKGTNKVNGGFGDKALMLNGRVIWDSTLTKLISPEGEDHVFYEGDAVVAARLSGENFANIDWSKPISVTSFLGIASSKVKANIVTYPWDMVHHNPKQLEIDMASMGCNGAKDGKIYDGVHLLAPERITVAQGASIKPGVVLDAEGGPIFIDEGAKIFPQAVIEGPCYVGKKSAIKIAAKIYEGTSIGEVCKVGGEVEESIIHSYSNKQHEGFLGHAYLGMWVNLGADTNNSDLKNDYGTVTCFINGEPVSTGSQFVGSTIGDHSKTGINTMLNTGTIVGVCCNIFGSDFPPKFIPCFSWGGANRMVEYQFDKCMQVARRVMKRRNMDLTDVEESVFRKIYEETARKRKDFFVLHQ
ncbi:MAG: putative sugar nucleotidyl transferase [Candidatus Omnitrophota bacterium]